MMKLRLIFLFLAIPCSALAQSGGGFIQGQTLTAAELNSAYALKTDYPVISLPVNNAGAAITLVTPNSTSAAWDSSPLAALHIASPATATTRSFLAGLWVETNANAVDKGRGILVNNYGQSDGIYVQMDGPNGSGLAVLQQTDSANSTGIIVGTTLGTQTGVTIRQETDIAAGASKSLLLLQALTNGGNASSATQMLAIASDAANQTGIITVLTGANSNALVVQNPVNTTLAQINGAGGIWGTAFYAGAGTTPGVSCTVNTPAHLTVIAGIVTLCN
jgi:hypothetical protein